MFQNVTMVTPFLSRMSQNQGKSDRSLVSPYTASVASNTKKGAS
jgi:hypothetical protein